MNKRAEEGAWGLQEIIALALVLLVVGGVLLFFFNNDINQYFRNLLPTYQGNNQSSDELVAGADDLIKNLCPMKVAEMYKKAGASENYLKINISGIVYSTDIYIGPKNGEIYPLKISRNYRIDSTIGKIDENKIVIIDSKYLSSLSMDNEAEKLLYNLLIKINGSTSRGSFCKPDPCIEEQKSYDPTIKFALSNSCLEGKDRILVLSGKLSIYTISFASGALENGINLIAVPFGSAGFYSFQETDPTKVPSELNGFENCFYTGSSFGCTVKK